MPTSLYPSVHDTTAVIVSHGPAMISMLLRWGGRDESPWVPRYLFFFQHRTRDSSFLLGMSQRQSRNGRRSLNLPRCNLRSWISAPENMGTGTRLHFHPRKRCFVCAVAHRGGHECALSRGQGALLHVVRDAVCAARLPPGGFVRHGLPQRQVPLLRRVRPGGRRARRPQHGVPHDAWHARLPPGPSRAGGGAQSLGRRR